MLTRTQRLVAVAAVIAGAFPAAAQLSGSAVLTSAPSGGAFQDTIVLQNTGTTTIGTLWFAWIPGEDFLPSLPTNITAPPGWYSYVEGGLYDTYSIQWYAYSSDYNLQPGQSLLGFGFTSADDPATLESASANFPRYHCTDSYVYIGFPEADPGYLFNVTVQTGTGGGCGSADYNCDGDVGTDADIEAFFACLAGSCPSAPCTSTADFNGDGDTGTDADIEAFFRVLAGGAC